MRAVPPRSWISCQSSHHSLRRYTHHRHCWCHRGWSHLRLAHCYLAHLCTMFLIQINKIYDTIKRHNILCNNSNILLSVRVIIRIRLLVVGMWKEFAESLLNNWELDFLQVLHSLDTTKFLAIKIWFKSPIKIHSAMSIVPMNK